MKGFGRGAEPRQEPDYPPGYAIRAVAVMEQGLQSARLPRPPRDLTEHDAEEHFPFAARARKVKEPHEFPSQPTVYL